jgi:N-acylneuraminate cytidylyltransferase
LIERESVLAIIPARGGSKGVPRKNLRVLGNKPLIGWTIEAAHRSAYIDRVVLTSEDSEIIAVARTLGCDVPFVRPAELATDDTPGIAPVLHALQVLGGFDWVVLLQPTSPLRLAADIDACLETCLAQRAPACVSGTEPDKSPYWMYTQDATQRLRPLIGTGDEVLRRQDSPRVFALNGAVYVARVPWLLESRSFLGSETVGYWMPKERSWDIDTELDFTLVESVIAQSKKELT